MSDSFNNCTEDEHSAFDMCSGLVVDACSVCSYLDVVIPMFLSVFLLVVIVENIWTEER
jgi:hypothetical protein